MVRIVVMVRDRWIERGQSVPAITTWLSVSFVVATALLGGALGVLPDLVAGDPGASDFVPRLWTGLAFLASGLLALWAGVRLWRWREMLLEERGTAYIVEERAAAWTPEEKAAFFADLRANFPAVQSLPRAGALTGEWHWPLDEGAESWNDKVDDLVHFYWAMQYNHPQARRSALFIWAWWSVALAFSARVSAGRRGPELQVRHRPSLGREGRLDLETWRQDPHTFRPDPDPGPAPVQSVELPKDRVVTLDITPRVGASGLSGLSQWRHPVWSRTRRRAGAVRPTVLLVRMTRTTFGSDLRPSTPFDVPVRIVVDDAVGLGHSGRMTATLMEWRCLAPDGPFHPWSAFPALAQSAVKWVAARATQAQGPVLLGLLVPQEIAVGMGILIAHQITGRNEMEWPEHLWPLHPAHPAEDSKDRFVVPRLDLGRSSLKMTGQDMRRPGP